jgi:hypothetical protein
MTQHSTEHKDRDETDATCLEANDRETHKLLLWKLLILIVVLPTAELLLQLATL